MKQHGTGCLYENEMQLNDNLCIPEMVLVVGFTFLMIVRPQSDLLDVQRHRIFQIFDIWLNDDNLEINDSLLCYAILNE